MLRRDWIAYWIGVLLCLLPFFALGEEAFVVLTSYEEHPAWQEEFDSRQELFSVNEFYYTFGNENCQAGLAKTTSETNYLLFSNMGWQEAGQMYFQQAELESYWVRLQLHVPENTRVSVENFRFSQPTDKVWVKMVLEEMDSGQGYSWVHKEPLGLYSDEYHLRMMARKGVDLKAAIEEAGLVCDVMYNPGTEEAYSETVKVLSPDLAEQSYDRWVEVTALTAKKLSDEEALRTVITTEEFWDRGDIYEECQYYLHKKDLWEITATVTKEFGYPLVGYRWRGHLVGGGWEKWSEIPTRYDVRNDLEPEETEGEVRFYLVATDAGSDGETLENLQYREVSLEYATEYVGEFDYFYTPGPKYQVKVDMSKVELTE